MLKDIKVISIMNQKGGVGKTTTALNLGAALTALKKKILVIDLDPQANLTTSLGLDPDELQFTITGLINKKVDSYKYGIEQNYIIKTDEGLSLIAADIELSSIITTMKESLVRESILLSLVEDIKNDYDYIIIDCPPSLDLLTVNALVASDGVIVPVQTQYLAMKGMEKLFELITEVKSKINYDLMIMGILFTMYNKSTNLSKQVVKTISDEYSKFVFVFKSMIHNTTKAAESPIFGQSILSYCKNSDAAKDYESLAAEIITMRRG